MGNFIGKDSISEDSLKEAIASLPSSLSDEYVSYDFNRYRPKVELGGIKYGLYDRIKVGENDDKPNIELTEEEQIIYDAEAYDNGNEVPEEYLKYQNIVDEVFTRVDELLDEYALTKNIIDNSFHQTYTNIELDDVINELSLNSSISDNHFFILSHDGKDTIYVSVAEIIPDKMSDLFGILKSCVNEDIESVNWVVLNKEQKILIDDGNITIKDDKKDVLLAFIKTLSGQNKDEQQSLDKSNINRLETQKI